MLKLTLFDSPKSSLAGTSLSEKLNGKALALLTYLAVTGQPQPRDILIDLLWTDIATNQARKNFRTLLYELRLLVDDYLIVNRQDVAFNRELPYWLDVEMFQTHLRPAQMKSEPAMLQSILELYRGEFMRGFYLQNAPVFEDWQVQQREQFYQLAAQGLHSLTEQYADQALLPLALAVNARLLTLAPEDEDAHRWRMKILAGSGQRTLALEQFQRCQQMLVVEFGVEPEAETLALYQAISAGTFILTPSRKELPATMPATAPSTHRSHPLGAATLASKPSSAAKQAGATVLSNRTQPTAPPVNQANSSTRFIGYEQELTRFDQALATALAGQGQILLVAGEAGSGKSTLLAEFVRRSQRQTSELLVVQSECGMGAGILACHELLCQLLSESHLCPNHTQADFDVWLAGVYDSSSAHIYFQRFTTQITQLAAQQPLLLILDDLHWADAATLNLFFLLSRRITQSRVLLIGAYRPEELMPSGGQLEPLFTNYLHQLQRYFGDIVVDLNERTYADRWHFMNQLLEAHAMPLPEQARSVFFHYTRGHPLFTIQLLKETLPATSNPERWQRKEQPFPSAVTRLMAQRIGRLSAELQEILTIACVVGETFSAEVIAHLLQIDPGKLIRRLSGELDRQYHLIAVQETQWIGKKRQTLYSFRYPLLQQYLYHRLDAGERCHLHEQVGLSLEQLYQNELGQMVPQLAWHFTAAGLLEKVSAYRQISTLSPSPSSQPLVIETNPQTILLPFLFASGQRSVPM